MDEIPELKPEDTLMLTCVVTHKETGLIIGTYSGPDAHAEGFEANWVSEPVAFFKDMFVVGMNYDVTTEYRVKNPAQILKLHEIIDKTHASAYIVISKEVVKELMGDAFDE